MFRELIARSVHDLDRLKSRWEQLLAPGHSIFQTFAWSRLAVAMFAATALPYIVAAESDSSAAIIPAALMAGGTCVGLLGEALFDYRDILSAGDETAQRSAWSSVAGLHLPLSFYSLRGASSQQRWSEFEPKFFCNSLYANPSDMNADVYRQHHSRLASRTRRLRRKGIELHRYNGSDSTVIRTIYEKKSQQPTPQGNLFVDPRRREFMVQVAAADPAACEVFTYETAGELVAALVTFRHQEMRHLYTVYYDVRWADLSPGQLIVYEVTALSLADGLTCDFMTGEYPYKARVSTGSVPLYRVTTTPETLSAIASGNVETSPIAA